VSEHDQETPGAPEPQDREGAPAEPEQAGRRDPIVRLNRDRSEWRGELADPALTDRLESVNPESFYRRRDFLARTAALAGVAGMASVLPVETLVSEAAKRQLARPYPSPRNMPIDTFVVLMMENRSFDHYFGWREGADGKNTGLTYPDPAGNPVPTYHLAPDFQGCDHPDPAHGWESGRHQYGEGRLDGFVQGNEEGDGSDEFAAGYYLRDDIPFIPAAAEAYQLYDRWFCSIMASTYPNRHYQLAAQNGGQKSNLLPPETEFKTGFPWETIFDRALSKGVSVGYYVSDLPVPALYGLRGMEWVRPASQFYADAAAGLLPQICFVDPPFRDGGGGDGVSADEHPHGDIRLGQAFMSDIAHAFIESPQYARGAMFINYDEWGGFFDHVAPPHVPDDRANRNDLYEDWSFCGFRVPGVAISPFTRGGDVSHMTVTHESILKLISYRFGLGYLTARHRYASDIGRSFNFDNPDPKPPELPDPGQVAATPCSLGGSGREGTTARPEPHHLAKLETSGLLDELGYEVRPADFDQIFRNPDGVAKALAEGDRKSR
jgi:phospholipase C